MSRKYKPQTDLALKLDCSEKPEFTKEDHERKAYKAKWASKVLAETTHEPNNTVIHVDFKNKRRL